MCRFFDKDGTGKLPKEAFKELMTKSGANGLSDKEFDDAMAQVDLDGDGFIDLAEYLAWLENPDQTESGVVVTIRGSVVTVDGANFRVPEMGLDCAQRYSPGNECRYIFDPGKCVFDAIKAAAATKNDQIFFVCESATVNGACMAVLFCQFADYIAPRIYPRWQEGWDHFSKNCHFVTVCATSNTPLLLHGGSCGAKNSVMCIESICGDNVKAPGRPGKTDFIFVETGDYLSMGCGAAATIADAYSSRGSSATFIRKASEFKEGFLKAAIQQGDYTDGFRDTFGGQRSNAYTCRWASESLSSGYTCCEAQLELAEGLEPLQPTPTAAKPVPVDADADFPAFANRECAQTFVFYSGGGEAQEFCDDLKDQAQAHVSFLPLSTTMSELPWKENPQEIRIVVVLDANVDFTKTKCSVVSTALEELEFHHETHKAFVVLNSRPVGKISADIAYSRVRLFNYLSFDSGVMWVTLLVDDNKAKATSFLNLAWLAKDFNMSRFSAQVSISVSVASEPINFFTLHSTVPKGRAACIFTFNASKDSLMAADAMLNSAVSRPCNSLIKRVTIYTQTGRKASQEWMVVAGSDVIDILNAQTCGFDEPALKVAAVKVGRFDFASGDEGDDVSRYEEECSEHLAFIVGAVSAVQKLQDPDLTDFRPED
jgi:hypothetical protein